jgi:predicted O-methyltransferase YrrM
MKEQIEQAYPKAYAEIDQSTKDSGFTMASDVLTCSLLRTLASSKPAGQFLELGTGTGLGTSWILDGMDNASSLISVDFDQQFLSIAEKFLGNDKRLKLIHSDGGEWIAKNKHQKFDYIFADTWHGKYLMLDEAINMLKEGGIYIIDDMLPQPNWPEGHAEKATKLIADIEKRTDIIITKQNWATGLIIAVKSYNRNTINKDLN